MRFQGRVALVTGGSRGIGKATALKLAREGATVAVHYSRAVAKAEAVCEQIRGLGQKAIPVQADIADREAVNRMVEKVTEELGTMRDRRKNAAECDLGIDQIPFSLTFVKRNTGGVLLMVLSKYSSEDCRS